MTKKRILLAAQAALAAVALAFALSWLLGPGPSLWRLKRAYAAKENLTKESPCLTALGYRIYQAGIGPLYYERPVYLSTRMVARKPDFAAYYVSALTRYGTVLAEVHLVRDGWRWKMDDVILVTVAGAPLHSPVSMLLNDAAQ